MSVLIVIFIISFLIIIHELGHYLAAKKAKVGIEEFGLGYPPKLIKLFTHQGVDFTLNLIPFGGFVRLEGENGPEDSTDKTQPTSATAQTCQASPTAFFNKSPKQKLVVTLSGVATNLIFAVIAFAFVFSVMGIPASLLDQARIAQIAPDSPARQAGLPENVNIVEIRAQEAAYQINSFTQVQEVVAQHLGQDIQIVVTEACEGVSCPDETQEFVVYARTLEETPSGQGALGIAFQDVVLTFYPWYEMPFRGTWYGLQQAVGFGFLIIRALGGMVSQLAQTGSVSKDVAGPVGIVYEAQQGNIISDNFWMNLGFAGMLSLNLAIINLLPIPALDGGRALFIFLEKIFGVEKINKIELYANYAGFAFIIVLIVTITISDISRIIN